MRVHLVAAFLIVVSSASCQKEQTPAAQSSATPGAEASPVPQAEIPPAVASPSPDAAVSSPTQPATAATSVATSDGEQAGVSLTVTELKRGSGGTTTLKFTIVNGGTEPFKFGYDLADPGNHSIDYATVGGVHLLDPVNKKKFFVVRDSDNRCVCSRDLKEVAPGGRLNLWAKFPSPADAPRVTIVVPHFMPMDDAPVS